MAKKTKTKNTDAKANVNIDELVNEGKNLNEAEIKETCKQIAEEKENRTLEEEQIDFVEGTEPTVNQETTEEVVKEEETVDPVEEVSDNIDDVIAECTGMTEEKVEEKTEGEKTVKDDEPWYVARAMRGNDYFNW